jgi:hypothetical protein
MEVTNSRCIKILLDEMKNFEEGRPQLVELVPAPTPTPTLTPKQLEELNAFCDRTIKRCSDMPASSTAEYILLSNADKIGMFTRRMRMISYLLQNEENMLLAMIYVNISTSNPFATKMGVFRDIESLVWGLTQQSSSGFSEVSIDRNTNEMSCYNSGVSYEAFNQQAAIRFLCEGNIEQLELLRQGLKVGTNVELFVASARKHFVNLAYGIFGEFFFEAFTSKTYDTCGFGKFQKMDITRGSEPCWSSGEFQALLTRVQQARQRGLNPEEILVSIEENDILMQYQRLLEGVFNSFTLEEILVVISLGRCCVNIHKKAEAIRNAGTEFI